jgi:hypothetical protein
MPVWTVDTWKIKAGRRVAFSSELPRFEALRGLFCSETYETPGFFGRQRRGRAKRRFISGETARHTYRAWKPLERMCWNIALT